LHHEALKSQLVLRRAYWLKWWE